MTFPKRPPHPPPPARDTKSNLYEAALEAVKDRAAQAQAKAAATRRALPRRRFHWIRLLLILGLVELVLLVIRPGWLGGPRSLPPESPGVAAASLRLVLARERDRILAYSQRTGRLPATLQEAGSTAAGLDYHRVGDTFLLSGHAGDSLIVLRSTDSVATFLGESLRRLKNRNQP